MRILVGYDGTDLAKKALKLAQDHANAFGAKIFVLHSKVTDLPQKEHEQDAEELEKVKRDLESQGLSCETHLVVRNMDPGDHIVTFAKENQIDEIVIGVRMRSKVGKLLMGSTAQHVILQAPCPVVSVK